jgi:O-antigen/teichoic acid export membrane protein
MVNRRAVGAIPSWARYWAADSGILLASQVFATAATSAAAVLIARDVAPRDWGIFSGFLSVSVGLSLLAQFGVGTWLMRELSRVFAESNGVSGDYDLDLVDGAVCVNSAAALLLTIGGIVVSVARGEPLGLTAALGFLLAYGGLYAVSAVMETHLRARRQIRRLAMINIAEKCALVVLVAAAVISGRGLWALGAAYLIPGAGRVAIVRFFVFTRERRARLAIPSLAKARSLLSESFPFALAAGSLNLLPKLDTFVVLAFSAEAAGFYAIGDRLLSAAAIIPATLSSTLYPFFARRESGARARPWRLAAFFSMIGACFAVAGIILAPTIVPAIFGDQYHQAIMPVRVFLAAMPLTFAIGPLLVFSYSLHRERSVVRVTIFSSVAGTGFIVLGQVLGGATYAACGYLLRQVLFLVGLLLMARRVGQGGTEDPDPATTLYPRVIEESL